MAKRYTVHLRFTGAASMEIQADSIEDVRRKVSELELSDITRVGHAEITASAAPGGHDEDDAETANRPRPSGWYRPG
jgi:hypothetical protein